MKLNSGDSFITQTKIFADETMADYDQVNDFDMSPPKQDNKWKVSVWLWCYKAICVGPRDRVTVCVPPFCPSVMTGDDW